MAKPQPLRYRDVNDLMSQLPTEEYKLMQPLRELILDSLPTVQEQLRYNVPFYYLKKRIAFLWPASVPWGRVESGVVLGFPSGAAFQDQRFFDSGDQQQLRRINFKHPQQIEPAIVRMLLFEASTIDH